MTSTLQDQPGWPAPVGSPRSTTAATGGPRIGAGHRTAWIVLGSVMTVGMLWWGALNVVGLLAHETRTTIETVDATGLTTIDIDNNDGSIRVVATDDDTITITTRISEGLRDPDSSYRIEGDRLILDGDCSGPPVGDVWCSIRYDVEIPRALAVVADASDARVTVIGAAGPVDVHSSNGSIVLEDVTSEQVVARTSNGRVRIEMAAAPMAVEARTSNGSVTVELPEGPEVFAVDADTSNGSENIEVRTDPSSDRTIVLRSSNGSVTVRYAP